MAERERNAKTDNKVEIILQDNIGDTYSIISHEHGGSVTDMQKNNNTDTYFEDLKIFVLQSRRFVDYEFYRNESERYDYMRNLQMNTHNRTSVLGNFSARLFNIQKRKMNLILC